MKRVAKIVLLAVVLVVAFLCEVGLYRDYGIKGIFGGVFAAFIVWLHLFVGSAVWYGDEWKHFLWASHRAVGILMGVILVGVAFGLVYFMGHLVHLDASYEKPIFVGFLLYGMGFGILGVMIITILLRVIVRRHVGLVCDLWSLVRGGMGFIGGWLKEE